MNGLEQIVTIEQIAITEDHCTVGLDLHGSESHLVGLGGGSVVVQGEPLGDVLKRHEISRVDLLIVDVEGAELSVLRSFPWGSVSIGRVFCELHPYNWSLFGYTGTDFQRFLAERRLGCLDMYLTEHRSFCGQDYLGPCLLCPRE